MCRAVEACAIVRRADRDLVSAILEVGEPIPLSLLEAVEALPFATRDAEGIYIAEPVRRALVDWMSGVEAERYQLWRKIVSRLRTAGRSGRWRYMAELLHLLERPALRNAFFRCVRATFSDAFPLWRTHEGGATVGCALSWGSQHGVRFTTGDRRGSVAP